MPWCKKVKNDQKPKSRGRFTKRRRSGSELRGTFVYGCMLDVRLVACGRENSPWESYFLLLLLENAHSVRVTLAVHLCVRRAGKIKPQKEFEQNISFSSDRWQWAVWDPTTYVYNTAERSFTVTRVRLSPASAAFASVLLFLCFPVGFNCFPVLTVHVLVLCLRFLAFVTVRHGHLASRAG